MHLYCFFSPFGALELILGLVIFKAVYQIVVLDVGVYSSIRCRSCECCHSVHYSFRVSILDFLQMLLVVRTSD